MDHPQFQLLLKMAQDTLAGNGMQLPLAAPAATHAAPAAAAAVTSGSNKRGRDPSSEEEVGVKADQHNSRQRQMLTVPSSPGALLQPCRAGLTSIPAAPALVPVHLCAGTQAGVQTGHSTCYLHHRIPSARQALPSPQGG
mmetsp:Transcript_29167/g.75513  ORF Transcript_29167/g.75513 Transcript_29167/m.75513 type:complete len:140 (+) Transcript_29167:452-871(+)